MKIKFSSFVMFSLGLSVYIGLLLIIMVYLLFFNIGLESQRIEIDYSFFLAIKIISHNLLNFTFTIVTFPAAIFSIGFNWIYNLIPISIAVSSKGWEYGCYYLFPHGFFEIPNMFIYQYLSWEMMKLFWRYRNLSIIIMFVLKNKHWFISSVLLTIIAGFLEGVVRK